MGLFCFPKGDRLIQFLDATPSSVLLKGDPEEEKGYIKKEIGEELYEIELRKRELTPQIIEKFPLQEEKSQLDKRG